MVDFFETVKIIREHLELPINVKKELDRRLLDYSREDHIGRPYTQYRIQCLIQPYATEAVDLLIRRKEEQKKLEEANIERIKSITTDILANFHKYLEQAEISNEPLTKTQIEICRQLIRTYTLSEDYEPVIKLYSILNYKIKSRPQPLFDFVAEINNMAFEYKRFGGIIQLQKDSFIDLSLNEKSFATVKYTECLAQLKNLSPILFGICIEILKKLGITELDISFPNELSDVADSELLNKMPSLNDYAADTTNQPTTNQPTTKE